MKCKYCDGTGKSNMYKDGAFVDCMYCCGTGEMEVEMTNDEWRRTCSTEEFGEFLYDIRYDYQVPWKNKGVVEWLKQPHR